MTALAAAPELPETATDEAKAVAETAETPVIRVARYAWAILLARIYEVFPLTCPKCGGMMKIIAFIDEGDAIQEGLAHLGEPVDPPRIAPRNLFDLGAGTDNLFHAERVRTTLKLTVTNLTNKVALYNFLSTFSGTHFVSPRAYQMELGWTW